MFHCAEGCVTAIDLEKLTEGMLGLSPRRGASMAEAASVCLDDQGHASPTDLELSGSMNEVASMTWASPDDQARRSWADETDATEHGAYAVALSIAKETRGLNALERSRKFNGFDYWLGTDESTLFSDKVRLEVSGIRNGDTGQVNGRVKEKLAQIDTSAGVLRGLVIVVEFGNARARVVDR